MSYVVVVLETKCHINSRTERSHHKTERAAKACRTRLYTKGEYPWGLLTIMPLAEYEKQVPMITVINLMSKKPVEIRADTPWNCRVDSETYWCS